MKINLSKLQKYFRNIFADGFIHILRKRILFEYFIKMETKLEEMVQVFVKSEPGSSEKIFF